MLLNNKDKLALVISRSKNLVGFSDPSLQPDQWVLFFGKPKSLEFLLKPITGDFFIPSETIEKMTQSQPSERLIRQRHLALEVSAQ